MTKKVYKQKYFWKIRLLGRGSRKTNIEGGLPKKGGLGQFVDLRGTLARKRGWCFWGGVDTPMRSMRVVQNLKRNLFFVSKMTRIWWILIWALKSLKNLHFDWSLLCKLYNVWPKKVQRSIFHDTRVMQNLKKNWLVVWKMTWGI